MKSRLNKKQRDARNQDIRDAYFNWGWSIRRIQKRHKLKSPKSIYNILYPERYNKYQLSRYHSKKVVA